MKGCCRCVAESDFYSRVWKCCHLQRELLNSEIKPSETSQVKISLQNDRFHGSACSRWEKKNAFHFYQNETHVPAYLERNTTVPYINITSRQLMQKVAEKHRPRTDTDNVFRISQIRNFKEFYWNKDKFQSQSLIVFKKAYSVVVRQHFMTFLQSPLSLLQHLVYTQRNKKGEGKKTLYNRSFWHNQLIQQFSCAGYFQTFYSPSERHMLADLLFHNGLFKHCDRGEIQ